jgi:hypothetical protein
MKKLFITLFLSILFLYTLFADNKKPSWKKNHINGYATECMMDRFFRYNDNWQRIEGEHGRNGIDGLYIKQKNNIIKEVLITESKYNHSRLGKIKKGTIRQMSKEWILAKLKILQKYHKNSPFYKQLITHVQNNHYRARLFKLKPLKNGKYKIILYHIKNKTDNKSITKHNKTEIIIDFKNPKNSFESDMIDTYNKCQREYKL